MKTPAQRTTRVLVADDHPFVRRGLRDFLTHLPTPAEVIEAENCQEALDKVGTEKVDVVVLDLNMPGRGGLDTLRDLKARRPDLPVLILSMHPDDQLGVRAMRAGADGYLTKADPPEELASAIREVLAGRKYVSPSLAQKLAVAVQADSDRPAHESLSDREYQVFLMIAAGRMPSQIAQELSLSVKTIGTYRERILEKMNLRSNGELIQYAVRMGLV